MGSKLNKKLLALADRCEALAAEIRSALSESETPSDESVTPRPKLPDSDLDAQIEQLRQGGREQAAATLAALPHAALARIYRRLGGSSRNAKKSKDFVLGRILWQLFDFSQGHEILKQQTNQ